MSQKPETVFRTRFRKKLDQIPNCWFESIQQKTISGTPDIIGCVRGFFVALELKAKDGMDASALQRLKLTRIAQANGLGVVVTPGNADIILELIADKAEEKQE